MLLPFFFVSWMLLLGAGIVEALKHLSIKSLFLYIGAYFEWIHSTTTRQAGTILYPAVQCLPMCSRHFDSGTSSQVKPALRMMQAVTVPCYIICAVWGTLACPPNPSRLLSLHPPATSTPSPFACPIRPPPCSVVRCRPPLPPRRPAPSPHPGVHQRRMRAHLRHVPASSHQV